MCLGCRRRAPKRDLARFVAVPCGGGRVLTPDPDGVMPGRGLYTCRSRACFAQAVERRAFARGARGPVRVDGALGQEFADGEAVSGG